MIYRLLTSAASILLLFAACADEDAIQETPSNHASEMPTGSSTLPTQSPRFTASVEVDELAYVGNDGALWLRSRNGESRLLYAPENRFVYYPEWSPDGSKIAFTALVFGEDAPSLNNPVAVVVDDSGREVLRVPDAILPHWSPNGEELSVLTQIAGQDLTFFATPAIVDLATGATRLLAPVLDSISDAPRWSPDGTILAYTSREGVSLVQHSDASIHRRVMEADAFNLFYLTPVWSATGGLAVFEADKRDPAAAAGFFVTVSQEGGPITRVSDSMPDKCGRSVDLRDAEAHWIPNASLLAWGIECPGANSRAGIWLKDMLNGQNGRFIDVSAVSTSVSWMDVSPDGRVIAFSSHRAPIGARRALFPRSDIYAVPLAGGNPELLVAGGMLPIWRPTP